MSGSMQGAGGVGGLLLITDHSALGTPSYYPTYDGNGNVSEYVDESGDEVAHFEYDPFGNLTVDSESNAEEFPYRFSTKPQDLTTGLYYYGYRYYDPVTGRWPSRDPIEEEGGINVYGFVGNDGVNQWDVLGHSSGWTWTIPSNTDFIAAYDISMTRRAHGAPVLYFRGGAAVLITLSGMNHTLFAYYLSGAGGSYDLTGNATIKSEVLATFQADMTAAHSAVKKDVESFTCPQSQTNDFESYAIGDTAYSALVRKSFTSSIWVIRRATAGMRKQVSATVTCACNPHTGDYEPASAFTEAKFKLYFYDQFADAADIPHKIPGSQEFNGSAQFDQIGAWGKEISSAGIYNR